MDSKSSTHLWDAVVIGAGPAGSVTARELARSGCRVMLIDQQRFPRSKVCGCCINGAAVAALCHLGLAHVLADALPLQRTCIAAGKRRAVVPLHGGVSLSREQFDLRLVREAIESGVEFLPGTHARLGAELPESRSVLLNEETIQARLVIVATGLAGKASEVEPGSRIGVGAMITAELATDYYRKGTIYMATGRHGYVGLVRVEGGNLDIAAAIDPEFVKSQGSPARAVRRIVEDVGWPLPEGVSALNWKGTPGLTRRPAAIAAHRLFAVGDAAGYVEPFTGEGMGWALMSALTLAPIARRAVQRWDDRLMEDWRSAHRRVLGSRQRLCRLIARVLRSPRLCRLLVRSLSTLPILSRPVIAALNHPCHFPEMTRV